MSGGKPFIEQDLQQKNMGEDIMISKDKMSVTVGVAFVWFTTQFGGGFASGNQLRQYFVQFGIWAFVTCIMTQFLGAFLPVVCTEICKEA